MDIKVVAGGQNSLVVQVTGILTKDLSQPVTILDMAKVEGAKRLRLDSMVFAVQEKLGCLFWWKMKEQDEPVLMLPVESRGRFDWEAIRGLHTPDGELEAVRMSTFGFTPPWKALTIMLDFTKQS